MRHLTDILLAWRDFLVLAFVIVASVIIMFLKNDGIALGGIQGAVIETLALLQKPVSEISRIPGLIRANQRLRQRNAELLVENSRLSEAFLENQRLRSMLAFDTHHELDCLPAKVLGRGGLESIRSILLDVGDEDGVNNYQPIVAADGLVGKVIKVNKRSSIGQILYDRNFRVGARVQRSRVEGIVKWAGDESCLLSEVHKRADVKLGDVIITSSTSALFSPGIKIGTVVDIHKESSNLFQEVYLRPSVDFSKLEEVFIIRGKETAIDSSE
jgi:rod shape-determining protein MreC